MNESESKKSGFSAHVISAAATLAAVAALMHVNIARYDLMLLLGAFFGMIVAVLTQWWSMAYAAFLLGGVFALAVLKVTPFWGEYGFASAFIFTGIAVGAAIAATLIVNVCRVIF